MKYYLVCNNGLVQAYKPLIDGLTLSTNSPVEWFDTEAELEARVDELMGEGYYEANKEEE